MCTVELGPKLYLPKETGPNLVVYQANFESSFMRETEVFYMRESSQLLRDGTFAAYVDKVENRLKEEQKRMQQYLHESTHGALMLTCENVLIARHIDSFYEELQNRLSGDRMKGWSSAR